MSAKDAEQLQAVDALLSSMTGLLQRSEPLASLHDPNLDSAFLASSRQTALARVDIYREQFWLRHHASLSEDFPATSALLGERWAEVVRAYLERHPPCTPSLRELGFALPEFLAASDLGEDGQLPCALATLERAYLEVFDAPDEVGLDTALVSALEPEQWLGATIRLSGALRLLELEYPAADLRRSLRAGEALSLPQPRRHHYLAVYRRELGLWDQELGVEAYDLLRRLGAGVPLARACEETALELPSAGALLDAQLGEWFESWTRLGWIGAVVTAPA